MCVASVCFDAFGGVFVCVDVVVYGECLCVVVCVCDFLLCWCVVVLCFVCVLLSCVLMCVGGLCVLVVAL